ncbi:MAG: FAD-dependent oxidoreductase [Candidatus Omnitrophica bacterium]|nr:FAD-dependent oxidoreductase [Candidatus Omnitrophota bacterium]MCF7891636.1 FAD-dependent oxidoreductase [Candidatus Omnitrophota bacterium]MCF7895908.1 FAD-dependent oxidoreductase [Candidatus Omnitrophota bacterium]MCF7897257.1 FAD-dependent oxidoreductase [Candidatus Omnitrophota bacterium]MCF7909292.1 FAD-dependent oxidoreductase [Candidatus Omnitrophota bacterium]
MAKIVSLQFSQSIGRADSVKSFQFLSKQSLDFQPGQFAKILFDKNNISNKELNKYLSFSSPPGEKYLEFTKKLSKSKFSQRLNKLKNGDEVFIQAPLGNHVFKDKYKKVAFLIGGIGITPVVSILGHIVKKSLDADVILIYSNRKESEIAFEEKLNRWQKNNQNIKIFYTITDSRPNNSKFKLGYINEKMVSETIKDYKDRIFFIYGPPGMVSSMARLCANIGCGPDKVKKEEFLGY